VGPEPRQSYCRWQSQALPLGLSPPVIRRADHAPCPLSSALVEWYWHKVNPSQAHFVLPETLCEVRGHIDEGLMDELIAIQAAAAMEEGLVSPAQLVIDTFPSEQGSQRVTDATTL
jgi:hypothetical protein